MLESSHVLRPSSLDCQSFLFRCLIRASWRGFDPETGGGVASCRLPNTSVTYDGGRRNHGRGLGGEVCLSDKAKKKTKQKQKNPKKTETVYDII